jgi:hypothetical protein
MDKERRGKVRGKRKLRKGKKKKKMKIGMDNLDIL